VPRGHKRANDDWPVQEQEPELATRFAADAELWKETMRLMSDALLLGVTDDVRRAIRRVHAVLSKTGSPDKWTHALALMLRQREQARIAQSIREHRRGKLATHPTVEGRIDPPTTGAKIVSELQAMAAMRRERHGDAAPTWIDDPRLPIAIDTIGDEITGCTVNLGGPGGPGGGKTPETWAKVIVKNLSKARAANS
jgi:hypothetical protein